MSENDLVWRLRHPLWQHSEVDGTQLCKEETVADLNAAANEIESCRGPIMTDADKKLAHKIIGYLFDRPVRDMGGGLRIVSLPKSWCPVEERDLIVRVLQAATRHV